MEKLIELLNEYIRPKYEYGEYGVYLDKQNKLILEEQHSFMGYGIEEEWYTDVEFGESIIISKQFGFIKWLVENDKIDKSKVFSFIDTADKPYEDILCLLALSDEPINDLISFLK